MVTKIKIKKSVVYVSLFYFLVLSHSKEYLNKQKKRKKKRTLHHIVYSSIVLTAGNRNDWPNKTLFTIRFTGKTIQMKIFYLFESFVLLLSMNHIHI